MTGDRPAVVLIGPPGAGKSAVGPLLADRLGVEFRDTDADVGAMAGKPVGDIFVQDGEQAFRALEHEAATSALHELREQGGVLALGSGAVLDAGIQHLLGTRAGERAGERAGGEAGGEAGEGTGDRATVVYLSAEFATVARRTGLERPRVVVPGNPRGRLRAMLGERHALYQRLALVTVPTDDLEPDELADRIAAGITGR